MASRNGAFLNGNSLPSLDRVPSGNAELITFFNLSNRLDIVPLINVLAYFIALNLSSDKEISEENLDDYLKDKLAIPVEMRRYIKKHFILIKAGCKEFTIADYLKVHGPLQFDETDLYGGRDAKLEKKGVTSLQGVDLLPAFIEGLLLTNNCILDPTIDTYELKAPFKKFKAVSYMRLSGNQLRTLPNDFFIGLDSLKTIYIDHNFLTTIPSDLFEHNLNLVNIDLHSNKLKKLPTHLIGCRKLSAINLSDNQLTFMPKSFFFGYVMANNSRFVKKCTRRGSCKSVYCCKIYSCTKLTGQQTCRFT